MKTQAVIHRPGQARELKIAGQPMAILVTGEHTRHTSMFDWILPAGFATGLHVHRVQEETFYVLEGQCLWQVGDETVVATVGTFLFVPPGVPHNIGNASHSPARLLMTVSPPGHEHYFEELVELTSTSGSPDSRAIADLRRRYDTDQITTLTAASGSR